MLNKLRNHLRSAGLRGNGIVPRTTRTGRFQAVIVDGEKPAKAKTPIVHSTKEQRRDLQRKLGRG